jgi:hypothetical protein
LPVDVNYWRLNAQRLSQIIYYKTDTPNPAPGSSERNSLAETMEREQSIVGSIKKSIDFALRFYANEIRKDNGN